MEEFDFAHEVLFLGKSNSLPSNIPSRDKVFHAVLESFDSSPVSVFQVGAIETYNVQWRIGSGWSDLVWGDYINEFGGKLTVVDINLDNIAKSELASQKKGYPLETIYGDAIDHIEDGYNIYYLDGGNDPKETLDQFNKIKHTESVVLIDDYSIKGTLVDNQSVSEDYTVEIHQVANDVGVIDLRKK
tara:strand:- start:804 stop:1364 length:561 start_codon:yes stop_codon:yes gene_type:complete